MVMYLGGHITAGRHVSVTPDHPVGVRLDDRGFVMVALLIGIAVSSVWMAALLPAWRQQATREKEAELIFRGEQYARAIGLYRRKTGALPGNIDILVSQRYLRKKYLDPVTGKDFLPVGGGTVQPGSPPGAPQVGIVGVRSTSNEASIRIYQNQQTYSQFPFDWTTVAARMGNVPTQAPDPTRGGGPGGRGGARGGDVPARGRGGAVSAPAGGIGGRGDQAPARGGGELAPIPAPGRGRQ
jgi:type II secretory pathway pseudopilin PulG